MMGEEELVDGVPPAEEEEEGVNGAGECRERGMSEGEAPPVIVTGLSIDISEKLLVRLARLLRGGPFLPALSGSFPPLMEAEVEVEAEVEAEEEEEEIERGD